MQKDACRCGATNGGLTPLIFPFPMTDPICLPSAALLTPQARLT